MVEQDAEKWVGLSGREEAGEHSGRENTASSVRMSYACRHCE